MPGELPAYTDAHIKAALLAAGASGTIYSLVMPESEAALAAIVDDRDGHFDMYREPWSQKQDDMHVAYFDKWTQWSRPVVDFPADLFPFRYPTAGASEGIFKIMAEYLATSRRDGRDPSIHIFDGEYEGFPAYAASLGMAVVRHDRQDWRTVASAMPEGAMFWISQPSAIDGMVWSDFPDFIDRMAAELAADGAALDALIALEKPDLVVPEIEAIHTATLVRLEREHGQKVVPTARATHLTMDREGIRRLAAETLGVPTSAYRFVDTFEEYREAIGAVGLPCVVKPVMSS